jgi:hypothetical protein
MMLANRARVSCVTAARPVLLGVPPPPQQQQQQQGHKHQQQQQQQQRRQFLASQHAA